MRKKDVTLIVIPHGNDHVREFQCSKRLVGLLVGVAVVACGFALLFGAKYYIWARERANASALSERDEQVRELLESVRHKARVLEDKMKRLAQESDALRVIAELPEIDPDTRRVGIGGDASQAGAAYPFLDHPSAVLLEEVDAELDRLLRQTALEKASFEEIQAKLAVDQKLRDSTPSILPTYGYISSPFGYRRDPLTGRRMFHKGIDIAGRLRTPVYATAHGKVIYAKYSKGYGNAVMVDHGNGLKTLYAHLSKMHVKRGETVTRGQKIGEMGKTGRTSGCHLHYEVRKDGRAVNPWDYFYTKEDIG